MSLLDEKIFDIIFEKLKDNHKDKTYKIIDSLINFLLKFYLKLEGLTSKFSDFLGVESAFPLVIIYLSGLYFREKKEKIFNISIFPDFLEKEEMISIYKGVFNQYEKRCELKGLTFVPNLKGLETILLKKIKQAE